MRLQKSGSWIITAAVYFQGTIEPEDLRFLSLDGQRILTCSCLFLLFIMFTLIGTTWIIMHQRWFILEKNKTQQNVTLFLLDLRKEKESEAAQSCLTLCDPMGCRQPGASVQGIFQARVLEWVAISFSRGSSRPWDQTPVSCIAGRHFTVWASREALIWEKIL